MCSLRTQKSRIFDAILPYFCRIFAVFLTQFCRIFAVFLPYFCRIFAVFRSTSSADNHVHLLCLSPTPSTASPPRLAYSIYSLVSTFFYFFA
jgi:hypothetical protein